MSVFHKRIVLVVFAGENVPTGQHGVQLVVEILVFGFGEFRSRRHCLSHRQKLNFGRSYRAHYRHDALGFPVTERFFDDGQIDVQLAGNVFFGVVVARPAGSCQKPGKIHFNVAFGRKRHKIK